MRLVYGISKLTLSYVQGPEGKIVIRGCTKYTCVRVSIKYLKWQSSSETTKCCQFNDTQYLIGTNIMTKLLPDMCTTTSLMCGTNDAKAEMELVSDNSSCTKNLVILKH